MNMKTLPLFVATVVAALGLTPAAFADDPLSSVKEVVGKDLLAIAYVDLASVDVDACLSWAMQQELVPSEDEAEVKQVAAMAQEFFRQATTSGVDHVLALFQQQDLTMQGPPLFLFSISDGQDANKSVKSLRRILGLLQIPNFELQVHNHSILGGTAAQIEQAKSIVPVERPRLTAAWQEFGGRDAGVMLIGSDDTRRAVRELLPALDAPFETIDGKLVADHVLGLGVSLDLPREVDATISIQTTNNKTAEVIVDALTSGKEMLIADESEYSALVPKIGIAAIKNVTPRVDGTDVVLDLKPLLTDKLVLASMLEPARMGNQRTQRLNNLRQVILAMHNYESANRSWPAYANFDDDGKPLLSWRVHMLPYVEQNELYQQFKLDEPWNSSHNIKLVKKMPPVYADPSRKTRVINDAGRTTMVVPRAETTMFHSNEGIEFKEITDGSSNTIAIVNVIPERAVVWTQPVDWDVDMNNPVDGLFSDQAPKEATFARADGSVGTFFADTLSKTIKAMLTRAGGEIVVD